MTFKEVTNHLVLCDRCGVQQEKYGGGHENSLTLLRVIAPRYNWSEDLVEIAKDDQLLPIHLCPACKLLFYTFMKAPK